MVSAVARWRHVENTLAALTVVTSRHRVRPAMGFEDLNIRWPAYYLRLHQPDPVLLAEPRRDKPCRPISLEQPSWWVPLRSALGIACSR